MGLAFLPWLQSCSPRIVVEDSGTGLSLGCAVGDVTPTGAVLWLRGDEESMVSVRYSKDPVSSQWAELGPVKVREEVDFTAKIVFEGLEPWTTYYYRGVVLGKKPGPICRFRTAPSPEAATDVCFAFSGDSRESYRPFKIMDSIRAMRPDFFLHLGDTIYADRDGVASTLPEFWAKYRTNRADPPSQRLFAETSLYVTWDDHEVANDYDPAHPLAPIGRRAFLDYWPVRQDPGDRDRIYRSFRWGKALELFILDTRQYRDPLAGSMLGSRQKGWLLDALVSSRAYFKFVATSVPFSSPGRDKWGGFAKEREEILEFIERERIGGVIFLAADVHYAAVARLGRSALREVMVGPIGAPMGVVLRTAGKFEFFSRETFNYGLVKVRTASPPSAEIAILDQDNRLLYRLTLTNPPGRN